MSLSRGEFYAIAFCAVVGMFTVVTVVAYTARLAIAWAVG